MTPDDLPPHLTGERRAALLAELYAPEIDPTRAEALLEEYRESLPRAALSRCAHCGALVGRAFDHWGLDGPWWNADAPARPFEMAPCPHYFALTGALTIDRARLVRGPFVALPGPEAPFVIPRLLSHPAVRATIVRVPVGPHVGHAITYFAEPIPDELARAAPVPTWGTRGTPSEAAEVLDFDLAPWVASGKLAWVEPDDALLGLHRGLEGCPFIAASSAATTP